MHSVDGVDVGLHSSLLAELQLFVCVICAADLSAAQGDCTNRPYLPTCKVKADGLGCAAEKPRLPPRIIRFSGSPIIRCPQTQVQASKLKELRPFSYRTWDGVPG